MKWECIELGVALWLACILYLLPLKHRQSYGLRLLLATAAACVITVMAVLLAGAMPSLAAAAVFFLLYCLFIYSCGAMSLGAAVYCTAWAVITQQIAHEILFIFLREGLGGSLPLTLAAFAAVYSGVYVAAGITVARFMPEDGVYQVGPRQLSSAIFLLIVFEILFEFLKNGVNSGIRDVYTWNVLLVQCYCVTILYLQNTLFKKSAMKQELDTLNRLWHQQKAQYELSRESIALINHKCHDLKHQIAAMRVITGTKERERYLREVEESVQIYDSMIKTGNEVLDTVLTEKSLFCTANHIRINCIADGRPMDVFDPVDLYTVFGNALDNAIESVRQLDNQEIRMIDVLVYVRKQFLMIHIMNPMGSRPDFEGELPVSTKTQDGYHGFGLKSIRHIIQKYNGFMKIDTAESIFSLKILIPLSKQEEKAGR